MTIELGVLNPIGGSEYEEIDTAVDSGATEIVMGGDILTSVSITEGVAFKIPILE